MFFDNDNDDNDNGNDYDNDKYHSILITSLQPSSSSSSSHHIQSEPVLLFHSHLTVTPSSITLHSTNTVYSQPIPLELATLSSDGQFLLVATRTTVILYAIQEETLTMLTMVTTMFDISSIAIYPSCRTSLPNNEMEKESTKGLFFAVAQWVTNTVTLYALQADALSNPSTSSSSSSIPRIVFEKTYPSCVYDLTFTSTTSSSSSRETVHVRGNDGMEDGDKQTQIYQTHTNLYMMLSHVDGGVRVLTSITSSDWQEEKYFHMSSYPGRWIESKNPSVWLLVGHRPCLLYRRNESWL